MRDFFRGPALGRPARLLPAGRRNRKLPGLILLSALLLVPLAVLLLRQPGHPAPAADPLPPPVVPSSQPTTDPPATPPTAPPATPPTTEATTAPTSVPPTSDPPAPAPSVKKLTTATLAPGRTVKCARIVLAIDQSLSMDSYTGARDNALQQLVDWSRKNLNKRDEIAVIDFSGAAGVRQPPTRARSLTRIGPALTLASGSYYRPILDSLGTFPPTSCKTALVLLSDGDLADLPADASESGLLLRGSHVKFQRLLVPDPAITVPQAWSTAFPNGKPVLVDGLDPDETARVIGETIAKIVNTKIQYH